MTSAIGFGSVPVFGELLTHLKANNGVEVARDVVRITTVVVATVAMGFFPALTNSVQNVPYIGTLLTKFQLLTPLTRSVILGAISVPALALATGIFYISTAVTIAIQAKFVFDVITGLDLAAKLLTGIFLIYQWNKIQVGLLETDANRFSGLRLDEDAKDKVDGMAHAVSTTETVVQTSATQMPTGLAPVTHNSVGAVNGSTGNDATNTATAGV